MSEQRRPSVLIDSDDDGEVQEVTRTSGPPANQLSPVAVNQAASSPAPAQLPNFQLAQQELAAYLIQQLSAGMQAQAAQQLQIAQAHHAARAAFQAQQAQAVAQIAAPQSQPSARPKSSSTVSRKRGREEEKEQNQAAQTGKKSKTAEPNTAIDLDAIEFRMGLDQLQEIIQDVFGEQQLSAKDMNAMGLSFSSKKEFVEKVMPGIIQKGLFQLKCEYEQSLLRQKKSLAASSSLSSGPSSSSFFPAQNASSSASSSSAPTPFVPPSFSSSSSS